ncbi:DUF2062 domain-containing protein [Kiloniella laminariae]|uniref:DUF2062 domain-containing protein n=1 Tax=Kiloniella laminariae TaxID=454162 RepID=UPI00036CDC49|nr:DUF2062 domain-containing protein [Kiloniella laminariae]
MKSWFKNKMHARNKQEPSAGMLRLLYFRLVIPVLRSVDQPEIVARGVMMGLALGMTPTVGVQLYMVFVVWWVCRYVLHWQFSLIIAMAWSWLSNPLTMLPLYYLYYVTGRLLLLDFDPEQDFESFSRTIGQHLTFESGLWGTVVEVFHFMLEKAGTSILVGFLPYSIGLGLIGYWVSFKLATRYAEARKKRLAGLNTIDGASS